MQKSEKMIETLAHGYSSDSTQRELSNEYQHDKVKIVIKNCCIIVLWMKLSSALGGLRTILVVLRVYGMVFLHIVCQKLLFILSLYHIGDTKLTKQRWAD